MCDSLIMHISKFRETDISESHFVSLQQYELLYVDKAAGGYSVEIHTAR